MRKIATAVLLAWLVLMQPGCKRRQAGGPENTGRTIQAEFPIGGEFPIVLPARFKDRQCRFIFDTGCSVTSFNWGFKDELGKYIKTQTSTGSLRQKVPMDFHALPDGGLEIGPLRIKGNVGAMDYGELGSWLSEYDGLLGVDVMSQFVVQLDFRKDVVFFLKAGMKGSAKWGTGFDLRLEGRTPHLQVQLGEGISELFMIDTACPRIYLAQEKFEELVNGLHGGADYSKREITAETKRVASVVLRELRLGSLSYEDVRISEYARSFLGMDFLRRHSLVTFDFANSKVYLKMSGGGGSAAVRP